MNRTDDPELTAKIEALARADRRYRADAYFFLIRALAFASRELARRPESDHVDGKALLEGFRRLALREFGPLTLQVLEDWGLHRTEDIGNLVFALAEQGVLGVESDDRRADFADGYDFRRAFCEPFVCDLWPGQEPEPLRLA